MAKKNNINLVGIILAALALAGLVLVIVGMCVAVVSTDSQAASAAEIDKIGLFGKVWDDLAEFGKTFKTDVPSPTFGIIAFIVALIGAVLVLADGALKLLGKDIKLLGFVSVGVALVGAVLVLIAGLTLAGSVNDFVSVGGNLNKIEYSAGAGVWLGFIGGLSATAAGGLSLLKIGNK